MIDIESKIDDWCPKSLDSYKLWQLAQASNFAVLPEAGGWLDQPAWWLDDVEYIMLIEEWEELNDTLLTAPGRGAPQPPETVPDERD